MELEEKAKIAAGLSVRVFEKFKELPPNAMLFKGDNVYHLFFNEMDSNKQKEEIAFITMLLAVWIGEIDAIALNTEAWSMQVSPDTTPDLWKKFNGDGNKISDYVYETYGSIENSPYRQEVVVTIIDGEKKSGMANTPIIRKGLQIQLDETIYTDNDAPRNLEFKNRFNNLLYKAKQINLLFETMSQLNNRFNVSTNEMYQTCLKVIKNKAHLEFDIDVVLSKASRAFKLIQNGKADIKIH